MKEEEEEEGLRIRRGDWRDREHGPIQWSDSQRRRSRFRLQRLAGLHRPISQASLPFNSRKKKRKGVAAVALA